MTVETLGPGIVDPGMSEQRQAVTRLGVFMPECRTQLATRWPEKTVVFPRAVRRREEPGRLGAVRPRPQEEVAEVIPEVKTEADVVLTHLAAAEESLGDQPEALREGPEEAQEGPGEDPTVPQEALMPLVLCRVAPDTRTEF